MATQTVRRVKKDEVGEHSNVIAATADTSECVCVCVCVCVRVSSNKQNGCTCLFVCLCLLLSFFLLSSLIKTCMWLFSLQAYHQCICS